MEKIRSRRLRGGILWSWEKLSEIRNFLGIINFLELINVFITRKSPVESTKITKSPGWPDPDQQILWLENTQTCPYQTFLHQYRGALCFRCRIFNLSIFQKSLINNISLFKIEGNRIKEFHGVSGQNNELWRSEMGRD